MFCKAEAQNLVADPSMENYHLAYSIACPYDTTIVAIDWYNPTAASPDYMHALMFHYCQGIPNPTVPIPYNNFGYQWPLDGIAYWHFNTAYSYAEYIQGILTNSLITGHQYCVSFYLSLADSCWYAMDAIGALFTTWAVNSPTHPNLSGILQYTPQVISNKYITDRKNWVLVSGSFIAQGGEQYLTIGNFVPDSLYMSHVYHASGGSTSSWWKSTSYYVDMVSVYDCTGHNYLADAGYDTELCKRDSIQIGTDDYSNYEYSWSPTSGLSNPNSGMPFASPDTTTTYYLSVVDNFIQQSTDSVTVFVEECEESLILFVPNIFSPNGDGNNDVLYAYSTLIRELDFSIYNRWGEEVFHSNSLQKGWDGKNAETGVYVWQVKATLITEKQIERSGNVSLVR